MAVLLSAPGLAGFDKRVAAFAVGGPFDNPTGTAAYRRARESCQEMSAIGFVAMRRFLSCLAVLAVGGCVTTSGEFIGFEKADSSYRTVTMGFY
jgi:hypothetical protein